MFGNIVLLYILNCYMFPQKSELIMKMVFGLKLLLKQLCT